MQVDEPSSVCWHDDYICSDDGVYLEVACVHTTAPTMAQYLSSREIPQELLYAYLHSALLTSISQISDFDAWSYAFMHIFER